MLGSASESPRLNSLIFCQVSLDAREIMLSIHAPGKAKMTDECQGYGFRDTLCPHVGGGVRLWEPLGELRPLCHYQENHAVLEATAVPKVLAMWSTVKVH